MKNKNLAILTALAALILLVLGASLLVPKSAPVIQKDVNELELDFEPSSALPRGHRHGLWAFLPAAHAEAHTETHTEAHTEKSGEAPAPAAAPLSDAEVRAWLLITVGNVTYSPIPLKQEGNYTIRQDGGEKVNVVHVTTDSVTMASSTCENQLCVGEGTVTLENKENRILGGYIICLPNSVTLELYSTAEMLELLKSQPQKP